MTRPLRRLLAGAALAGAVALLAPPASASLPHCQYYVIFNKVVKVCPPV